VLGALGFALLLRETAGRNIYHELRRPVPLSLPRRRSGG